MTEPGRNADIFIFAWHPLTDDTADHRDPDQWLFHVVAECRLPPRKSISLAGVQALASAIPIGALADTVAAEAAAELLGPADGPSVAAS